MKPIWNNLLGYAMTAVFIIYIQEIQILIFLFSHLFQTLHMLRLTSF